jgi:hypothetical protein
MYIVSIGVVSGLFAIMLMIASHNLVSFNGCASAYGIGVGALLYREAYKLSKAAKIGWWRDKGMCYFSWLYIAVLSIKRKGMFGILHFLFILLSVFLSQSIMYLMILFWLKISLI